MSIRVELFTKRGCHLCERVHAVIEQARAQVDFELVVTDIESDPVLFETYKIDVPVVRVGGRKAFKYRVEVDELVERIRRAAKVSSSGT